MTGLLLVLLVLALIFGGVGLLVEGLLWLLIIAAALVVASIVLGYLRRGGRTVGRGNNNTL